MSFFWISETKMLAGNPKEYLAASFTEGRFKTSKMKKKVDNTQWNI